MSKHAEVIFEPGSHSVVSYDTEDELKGFLTEHHRRALSGETGGPTGHPAERITKVLLYDQHPDNYGIGGNVDAEHAKAAIDAMAQDNSVDAYRLIAILRDELSPTYTGDQGRHDSMYKMQPADELDLSFLTATTGDGE